MEMLRWRRWILWRQRPFLLWNQQTVPSDMKQHIWCTKDWWDTGMTISSIRHGRCTCTYSQPVPCVALCPAHVDIPGYIALVGEGRYADAVRLIRKDNPFPTTCGFICEHPCELRCRRDMVDDSVNIRTEACC